MMNDDKEKTTTTTKEKSRKNDNKHNKKKKKTEQSLLSSYICQFLRFGNKNNDDDAYDNDEGKDEKNGNNKNELE
eukprot:CAMPEP_0194183932 /NCGR_PEP_ID=MMETSP0154-20130528/34836_1 /TAXON_ID=1049557 /ORGANISM="Thalassiothrix antarctica, Strain L6-D1" /LENGTH=74 /DNA_ID=CAMNT_0038901209 /DNA_START=9 /DNA_END=230 /DNA_ORIENTATION=-